MIKIQGANLKRKEIHNLKKKKSQKKVIRKLEEIQNAKHAEGEKDIDWHDLVVIFNQFLRKNQKANLTKHHAQMLVLIMLFS